MSVLRTAVALAVLALPVVGCGPSDEGGAEQTDATGTEIVLEIEDGGLVGGVRRESVELGESVVVRVEGDVREQVHVHGYDLYIEPDGDSRLTFVALIPGRFEIELEQSGQLLVELTVS